MQDGGSLREQVDKLTNILLQTQEGLRYALRNLDGSNFNPAGLREILEPVTVRLEDGMKELRTELSITAEGLALDVASLESELQLKIGSDELAAAIEDVNGDVAAVSLRVDGLSTTVKNQAGDISALQQTASSLSTTVKNQAGDISALQQTASSLSSTVRSHTGSISSLQQTADSLTSTVQSQGGSISQISQTVNNIRLVAVTPAGGGAQLELTNGAGGTDTIGLTLSAVDGRNGGSIIKLGVGSTEISSPEIVFEGMVTFKDLKGEGKPTVITGDNITTGTIRGAQFMVGGTGKNQTLIKFRDSLSQTDGVDIGGIEYKFEGRDYDFDVAGRKLNFCDKLFLTTEGYEHGEPDGTYYPSVKVASAGRVSIEASNTTHGYVYIEGGGTLGQLDSSSNEAGVSIHAPNAPVRIQSRGHVWEFYGARLYLDDVEVVLTIKNS